ncbi:hypothetical protein DBR18_03335 [Pseudomonas sp. HMWF021]|nr:hypothetical protein DBR18_03335 [Pseudomonas sp. HMWF021]
MSTNTRFTLKHCGSWLASDEAGEPNTNLNPRSPHGWPPPPASRWSSDQCASTQAWRPAAH